jgi:hypothetical protein
VSLKLQLTESSIMIGVLERLRSQGIVALPIHDGLLVARSKTQEARKAMEEVSEKVCGLALPVAVKER